MSENSGVSGSRLSIQGNRYVVVGVLTMLIVALGVWIARQLIGSDTVHDGRLVDVVAHDLLVELRGNERFRGVEVTVSELDANTIVIGGEIGADDDIDALKEWLVGKERGFTLDVRPIPSE